MIGKINFTIPELELQDIIGLEEILRNKVDKEEGKSLSSNDFTDDFKAKVEGLSQLAITCFGENLISSDSGNITPNPFFFQKEHNFVMPTLGVGKFLFAYIGKQLGEGVTAKINNKDLNATPVYTKDFPGMNCYLFENKIEEDGNPTFSGLGAVLKITLEELQSIYQLQIREFLDYPTWENNKWLREKIADLESRILALEAKG